MAKRLVTLGWVKLSPKGGWWYLLFQFGPFAMLRMRAWLNTAERVLNEQLQEPEQIGHILYGAAGGYRESMDHCGVWDEIIREVKNG